MKKEEIISQVSALGFEKNAYIVFGSCPLTIAGLREALDIDMMVSKELFLQLRESGWIEQIKGGDDRPLTRGVFEVHDNWNFSTYSPTLEQLLATATIVDGVPFASLHEVRKWKAASGRPKDLADVALIDAYEQAR